MGWSAMRKATEEEMSELNAATEKIGQRHGFDGDAVSWDMSFFKEGYTSYDDKWKQADRAQRAYRRAVRKILGEGAEGIAYGHVGYHVK